MGKRQTLQIPNILLSVKDASVAISVSTKMVHLFRHHAEIRSG